MEHANRFDEDDSLFKLLIQNMNLISALSSENDTLRNIIELLPGNVYWKNKHGKFLGCNKNIAKIAGLQSSDDIIGKDALEIFGETFSLSSQQNDEAVIASQQEHNYEEIGLDIHGQPAIFLSKKIPLYHSSGELMGTITVSFDITERKKMEEEFKIAKEKAIASNLVKTQFVTAVNHELRTPLASIIGLVDLLKNEKLQTIESKKIIDSIESSAHYLLNLVDDVLDFSKVETAKDTLQIKFFSLKLLLSEVYDLLYPMAKNKNLELKLEIDSNIPDFIRTDARVLKHLLINLTNNALKYTETGSITIQVVSLKINRENAQLKISVIDTGLGIPADKFDIIFKPFHQLNDPNVRSSSRNGAGLGLSIVKKLAEAIEATLQVESQPGKGSTFSFTATFAIEQKKVLTAHKKNSIHLKNNSIKKPMVLVVEDDPIIQYIHKKLLINLGCMVDVVGSGHEAMKILKKHHDIIFLDLSLPDINGHDLIKKIRKTTSFTCPIIVISALINKEEEIASLQVGANGFVSKPISQAKLKELLSYHCHYLNLNLKMSEEIF